MLAALLPLASAPIELAEAEVAVGDERAHAARLGEGQRLAVVGLAALGVEPVGMGRDVAEQVQRVGREPGVTRRGFDRAVAQAPRLVEPTEQQTGTPQRVIGPAEIADDSPCRLTLEELLAFPKPVSASLASPSCASTQAEEATAQGSRRTTFPVRTTVIQRSISARAFAQSPSRRWSMPAALWA